MREIRPYKTVSGAMRALDNGGRFFNVFTKAGDGEISMGELKRVAGTGAGKQQSLLYFYMSLMELGSGERHKVADGLSEKLKGQFAEAEPAIVEGDFEDTLTADRTAIVEGYPSFLKNRSQFTAFLIVPIMAGKAMTMVMIPIFEKFDVYEVYSKPDLKGTKTVIAVLKGSRKLEPNLTVFGGTVRNLIFKPGSENPHKFYLETHYYIRRVVS